MHRSAVAHFGHSAQSSVSEHVEEALQTPTVSDEHGLAHSRLPSGFWHVNKFFAAQSIFTTFLQRGAATQSGSHNLQSSDGSHDFFSSQTVTTGFTQIFSAVSHTRGGLHCGSFSHAGWHLPSALHLDPPGHSPLGPHAMSVQEAVQ